jgi:rhamnulokinase
MSRAIAASYLAIDLGASSGRAVLGTLDGSAMRMQEIHRFATPMIERDDHLYWDIGAMWREIQSAVAKAFEIGRPLRSISVDSWAVDYVPLDANGAALRNPYSYRDSRIVGRLEVAVKLAGGSEALYDRTGIQFLPFNTICQIVADIADEPELVRQTATRLLIAEYFLYRLSGRRVAEATNASTTQLVDARTGDWATDLLAAIGDDARRWPEIVPPGTTLGPLLRELIPPGIADAPVVFASCAHDTAAAVAAVPAALDAPWAFISSGTWSLVGSELASSILTPDARDAGFTNEVGIDGTVRFLKNRAGMWVLEECRREWQSLGVDATYDEILQAAAVAPSTGITIDLNAGQFAGRGGMLRALERACRKQGVVPTTPGGVTRLILESLAVSHAEAIEQLEALTGVHAATVHVVGGGALNDLLNQLLADRCGRRVLAGPVEATVLGNLLVQARALGDLPSGVSVRAAARDSTTIREFTSSSPVHSLPLPRFSSDISLDTK